MNKWRTLDRITPMADDTFNLQIHEREENIEMAVRNGLKPRVLNNHDEGKCSPSTNRNLNVNLDASSKPNCTPEICGTDFMDEDFCFIKLQCDGLRASLRREKICREEVEKEKENMLMELKALEERCKEESLSHSEVKDKLLQEVLAKQHKINRLSVELIEVEEALEQRNKRLEEVRRTEQYWKEEVHSLRDEISHISKESMVFCSEIDRLKDEVKWRDALLKNCRCQVTQILDQSRNGEAARVFHSLIMPRLEGEKHLDVTEEEINNHQYIEKSHDNNCLVPADENGIIEKARIDENDLGQFPKDLEQSCHQYTEKTCNCQDSVTKLEAEMQKLNYLYTTEKEENLLLLREKEREMQALQQKVEKLECALRKLETENKDIQKARSVEFKYLEIEKERVATLQQQVECLKQYNIKMCASFKVKQRKTIVKGKQHAQELRKKVEGIMQNKLSLEEQMLKELHHLRTRTKKLLLDNFDLKTALNEKEEYLSAVKVDLIKAREVLKTEVYINNILSQRNRVIQDELLLCRNNINCSAVSPVCKSAYSPAFGDFLKKWCIKIQKALDNQAELCMLGSDKEIHDISLCPFKTFISPHDADIKSFAQKNAELLRMELFEMENSWLHGLIDHFQRKWMENINCLKPITMGDASEEVNRSYLRAQALIAVLEQGKIPLFIKNGDTSSCIGVSEDRKSICNTDSSLLQ